MGLLLIFSHLLVLPQADIRGRFEDALDHCKEVGVMSSCTFFCLNG